jgi:hypothetical protein
MPLYTPGPNRCGIPATVPVATAGRIHIVWWRGEDYSGPHGPPPSGPSLARRSKPLSRFCRTSHRFDSSPQSGRGGFPAAGPVAIHRQNPHCLVEGGGFEPPKAEPSDLQSDPFGHSGTPPINGSRVFCCPRELVSTPKRFPNQSFTGRAGQPARRPVAIQNPYSRGVCGSIPGGWTARLS